MALFPHYLRRSSIAIVSEVDVASLPSEPNDEQVGTSNGGQRPSLNSGFLFRRGWPIRSAEMKMSQIAAKIALPVQTGAIFGSAAIAVLYQALGFASSSRYYQDAERLGSVGGLAALVALASSMILIIVPKGLGCRKRGVSGSAISVSIVILNGLLNPMILPEDSESLRAYETKKNAEQGVHGNTH